MKQQKRNLQEAKQKLEWQYRAGVINESTYMKKLMLMEDDEVLGTKDVVPLSKVDPDTAKAALSGGQKDGGQTDDVVKSSAAKIAVGALKPAQTEIIKEKAFGIAVGLLGKGKWDGIDLGSIVSNDNYIMDGHHRWAAVFLIDPKATIKATVIDLPGKTLVTALNHVTAAKSGLGGNPGKGNVAEFTGEKIGAVIDNALKNGIKGEYPLKPEQVKELIGKVPGANGDANKGKEIMMKNADALPKQIMPGAPARIDMPVIKEPQVPVVASMLSKGSIDVKPPYSKDVKSKLDVKESIKRLNNLLKESVKRGNI